MVERLPTSSANVQIESVASLDRWRELVATRLMNLEISAPFDRFDACIMQTPLGPSTISSVRAAAQTVRRTSINIRREAQEPKFDLIHLRTGKFALAQGQASHVLATNDCVIVDRTQPFLFEISDSLCDVMTIPRGWLERWIPDPSGIAGHKINGSTGWGRALSVLLGEIDPSDMSNICLSRTMVAEQVAVLVALSVRAMPVVETRHRGAVLRRGRDVMRDRAGEAALSPRDVAHSVGISTRYLHTLFASAGTTFGRELMELRLERARQLLSSPSLAQLSVGDVAYRCGFADQGHMAKRFRTRFGVTPTELKRMLRS